MVGQLSHVPQSDLREPFLETLGEIRSWFHQRGIEHRIIGSLATSVYLEAPDECSLNFNRQNAYSPDQRVPDIDLIVPRAALAEVRGYRSALERAKFPVKLGLAFPRRTIDFRPEQSMSYLTSKKTQMPVDSRLFQSVERNLLGVTITTVEPRTLFHTYVTCGDRLRVKDTGKVMRLGEVIARDTADKPQESEYQAFHEFIRARRAERSLSHMAVSKVSTLVDELSPAARQRVLHFALPVAGKLGLR